MVYQGISQDVTCPDYPIQYTPTGSSTREADINELLDIPFSILIRQKRPNEYFPFYQNPLFLFEIDLSSVWPRFEVKSGTSLIEVKEISEEMIVAGMIKHNLIVQMSPIKEYTLRVRVKSIEKATPHIVGAEGT